MTAISREVSVNDDSHQEVGKFGSTMPIRALLYIGVLSYMCPTLPRHSIHVRCDVVKQTYLV